MKSFKGDGMKYEIWVKAKDGTEYRDATIGDKETAEEMCIAMRKKGTMCWVREAK